MWLCETKPQDSIVKIGQKLKNRLGIEEKVFIVNIYSFYGQGIQNIKFEWPDKSTTSYAMHDFESDIENM